MDLNSDCLKVTPVVSASEPERDLRYPVFSPSPVVVDIDPLRALERERVLDRLDARLRVPVSDRKSMFFAARVEGVVRDPVRLLKMDSFSENAVAADNEPVAALKKENLPARREVMPMEPVRLAKRPLIEDAVRLREPLIDLNNEACLERLEVEVSDAVKPTMRPQRTAPVTLMEQVRVLK